jgi:hypothetical protein
MDTSTENNWRKGSFCAFLGETEIKKRIPTHKRSHLYTVYTMGKFRYTLYVHAKWIPKGNIYNCKIMKLIIKVQCIVLRFLDLP